ncbi:MAG: hypothetical protein B0D91_12060 [Oceanospirillales bacterium LUC14_002_19_P2]|nr:MAG: hypothetical protein B0D91_12060 [Oceanospirillales bacterium LUC14_002_19_P2]
MATGDLDQFVTLSNISMIECDDQYIIELDHLILEELRKLPTYPTEDDWNSFYNSIKTFCTNALGLETRTFQTFVNYFRPRSSSEKNINLHLLTFIAQTLLQFTTANPREQERYDEWLISRTGNQRSLSRSVKNKLEQVVTDLNVENLYKQLLRKRTTAITLSVNNGKDDSASYSPEDIQILKQKIMTMIEIQMSAYMKECEEEAGQGMEQYKEYRLPCLFIGDGKDLARISYTFQSDDGTERNHPNNKRWNKLSFEEKQEFAVSEIARLVNGNERAMQHICRYANQNMTIGIQNGLAVGLLQSSFGEGTLISGSAGSSITIAKDTESNNIILTYRLYRRPAILWNNLFGEALFISEQRDREKWENTSLIDLTFSIILDPYANYDPTQIRCVDLQSTIFLP